jgi:hypothetical protein
MTNNDKKYPTTTILVGPCCSCLDCKPCRLILVEASARARANGRLKMCTQRGKLALDRGLEETAGTALHMQMRPVYILDFRSSSFLHQVFKLRLD